MQITAEMGYILAILWWGVAASVVLFVMTRKSKKAPHERCPEDTPRAALSPGTAIGRRLALKAMVEGHISLDEYLDHWSGREILKEPDLHALLRERIAEEVERELSRPVDPAAPRKYPCTICLGMHHDGEQCLVEKRQKALAGISGYDSASALLGAAGVDGGSGGGYKYIVTDPPPARIVESKFFIGQWVRVNEGGRRGGQLVQLTSVTEVASMTLWTFAYIAGGWDQLAEACFMVAVPMEGEWWEKRACFSTGHHKPHFKTDWEYKPVKWSYTSGDYTSARLDRMKERWDILFGTERESALCGCLVPVNFGHGHASKYRPGDKVRVRFNDRIYTLKTSSDPGHHDWLGEFGGSNYPLNEHSFEYAGPKKGEVWNHIECSKCQATYGNVGPIGLMNIDLDWLVSDVSRARINCGCLYRIGTQDKKG